jgi:RHS repeat-associated protein
MRNKILLALFLSFTIEAISQVPAADNPTGNANYNMNWIMSWVNDGSGNMLSGNKTFFDNSGRQVQVQNKVFYRSNPTTTYTHVLASQVVRDVYGREVLNTMAAPVDYADYIYMPGFIQATDGTNYTYKNFDLFDPSGTPTDLTNSPQPVGGQSAKGTLGWYYGASNTWEPYTATSNFPYSRESIYQDGTNNQKKQAGAGEVFVMGSNHETSGYTTPVSGELANYILVRNRFFPSTQVGALATTLENNAMQTVGRDPNQNEAVSISDKGGNVLMTARPGTDLIVNNTIGLIGPSAVNYNQQVVSSPGSNFNIQALGGANNLNVYLVSSSGVITPVYTGVAAAYPFNSAISGTGTLVIQSDAAFAVIYANSTAQYTVNSSTFASSGTPSLGYFKILANNTPVNITGSYTLYDMNTEAPTSLSSGNLNKGYYKVVANTGAVNVTYSIGYTDVAYNFYNQLGQLVASVPPNGVKLLEGTGYTNYSTLASIPYVSLYTYDTRGRLFSSSRPDNGLTQFYYRLDGKLRFSQNALQAAAGSFSFCNHDQYGRLIQFGVYTPGTGGVTFGSPAMTAILETTGLWGGLTNGTMTDVSQSNYDLTDNTYSVASNVSGYLQDPNYLGNSISKSMRYSTIVNNTPSTANLVSQTWYNYDNEGKMVWQIKYIPALGLNGYKSTDYTYDALSRLTKTIFQATVPAETFVHYFQFDPANGNLYQVYTANSDVGVSNATLQATYIYYLHGGLKRVQLGTNIQGLDYTYTLQGNLKTINNSNNASTADDPGGDAVATNGFNPDVYGEVLDYYPNDYNNTRASGIAPIDGVNTTSIVGSENYTGTIKAMSWYSTKPSGLGGSNAPTTYVYNFDQKYQLIASTWGTGLNFATVAAGFTATNLNRESIVVPGTGTPGTTSPGTSAYDGNGNILNLQRTNAAGTQTDVFAYNYKSGTNQLASITNTGTTGDSYAYSYDQAGREISETTSNSAYNKYLRYDASGKVTLVALDAGFSHPLVGFIYDEYGKRIEKLTYNSSYQLSKVTYYYQDVVYTQIVSNGTLGTLTPLEYAVQGKGGRVGIYEKQSNLYLYEIKDHLGTVRAIVAATGAVQTATDYYPFGMMIATIGSPYRYQYQGQYSEGDVETGWNSFELRMYNPRLGKWVVPDPANQYFSPYESMGNNPINNFDPTGADSPPTDGDYTIGDEYTDGEGSWKYMGGYWQPTKGTGGGNIFVGPVMGSVTVTPMDNVQNDAEGILQRGPDNELFNVTNTLVVNKELLRKIPSYYGTLQATMTRSIRNTEPGKIGSININWEVQGFHLVPVSVDLNSTIFSVSANDQGGVQGGVSAFGTTLKMGTGSAFPLSFVGSMDMETGDNQSIGIEAKFTPNSNFYTHAIIVAGVIASDGAAGPALSRLITNNPWVLSPVSLP